MKQIYHGLLASILKAPVIADSGTEIKNIDIIIVALKINIDRSRYL